MRSEGYSTWSVCVCVCVCAGADLEPKVEGGPEKGMVAACACGQRGRVLEGAKRGSCSFFELKSSIPVG